MKVMTASSVSVKRLAHLSNLAIISVYVTSVVIRSREVPIAVLFAGLISRPSRGSGKKNKCDVIVLVLLV